MSSLLRAAASTPSRRFGASAMVFAAILLAFVASERGASRGGTADLPSRDAAQDKFHHRMSRRAPGGQSFAGADAAIPIEKFASFNKPAVLDVGRSTAVKVVLSGAVLTDTASVFRNLSGDVETTGKITLGAFVTAKLTAPKDMLEITATDTSLRKVEKGKDVTFVWYVKPLRTGSIPIDLAVFSQDQAAAGAPVQMSEVMHQDWTAEAHGIAGILYWIKELEPIRVAIWTVFGGIGSLLTFFGLDRLWEKKVEARQSA